MDSHRLSLSLCTHMPCPALPPALRPLPLSPSRVHARRRDDVDCMLQTLGINAANPVCVMTQDTARNFLAGSSTKVSRVWGWVLGLGLGRTS